MRVSDQKKTASDRSNVISGSHDRQIDHPDHDQIVIWLYERLKSDVEFLKTAFGMHVEDKVNKVSCQIEYAIGQTNSYGSNLSVRGFADLMCKVEYDAWLNDEDRKIDQMHDEWELARKLHAQTEAPKYPSYDADEVDRTRQQSVCSEWSKKQKEFREGNPHWREPSRREKYVFIEVKTSVNIGETIRQINYYSSGREMKWCVCAPPFPHAKILNEQGIGFIPYEP